MERQMHVIMDDSGNLIFPANIPDEVQIAIRKAIVNCVEWEPMEWTDEDVAWAIKVSATG
jgi:hypothetical protein